MVSSKKRWLPRGNVLGIVGPMPKRTSVPDPSGLGVILKDFRSRFHKLPQEELARICGVGSSTIATYESGEDPKTHLPANPREATLERIARRMHEYAAKEGKPYAGSWERLYREMMVAAGKLSQDALDFHEGRGEEPTDAELARGDLKIPGLADLAADASSSWEELDTEEQRQVLDALRQMAKIVINDKLAGRRQRKLM